MSNTFKVAEIFSSINGEGTRAGELAVFVRLAGCNLNCSYCDTMWANSADTPFTEMTAQEIKAALLETGIRNVTLTGGEPLIHENVYELLSVLSDEEDISLEIETNGSVSIEQFAGLENRPIFTLDYKLPSSGMENKMVLNENLPFIEKKDCIKFVAGSETDLERAFEITEKYGLTEKCHVYLSPVFGKLGPAFMVEFMKKNTLNNVRLQLQLHKFIWDPSERGV
ncbi:MAG: putative 7-carboxy-7-deazaguanine synthase QueE [Oscillospiraceae bacterium]|nr:putative 7-carboxy-7-deazaguanine synthase QueE [Oscillospiraceae bacterium]